MNNFGDKIKSLRMKHDDTLRDLGEKLNFNYSNLSKIERGERKPSIEMLEAICSLYNVPMNYFFGEKVDTPPELANVGVEAIYLDKDLVEELTDEDIQDALKLIRDLKKHKAITPDNLLKLNEIANRD